MGNICSSITTDQLKGCKPVSTGNESTMYIANRDDIQGYVRDVSNPSIIRGIVFKAFSRFYRIEGSRTSLRPVDTIVIDDFGAFHKHQVDAVIFGWDSEIKKQISSMAIGRFVVVIVGKDKLSDSSIEVYGTEIGMSMRSGSKRDLNGTDFGANFPFGLSSEDGNEEPDFPASFSVLLNGQHSYQATIDYLNNISTEIIINTGNAYNQYELIYNAN